jgi:hypothetical protein
MERRSFFQLLFGALLAKWLPKPKPSTFGIAYKQIAPPNDGTWINLRRKTYPESLKVPRMPSKVTFEDDHAAHMEAVQRWFEAERKRMTDDLDRSVLNS